MSNYRTPETAVEVIACAFAYIEYEYVLSKCNGVIDSEMWKEGLAQVASSHAWDEAMNLARHMSIAHDFCERYEWCRKVTIRSGLGYARDHFADCMYKTDDQILADRNTR